MATDQYVLEKICQIVCNNWQVDAIYLYGSRADGRARDDSDWDIGVLFSEFLKDKLARAERTQEVKFELEKQLNTSQEFDVVDVEVVPPPLQYNIIRGQKIHDRNVPHVKKIEGSIISKIEKDYFNNAR